MIMPFLRLVAIYIVVILAAVLFFNRNTVMPLLGFGGDNDTPVMQTEAATGTPVAEAISEAPKPVARPEPQAIVQPVAEAPAPQQPPKYPTADTAQIVTPAAQPAAPAPAAKPAANLESRLKQARQAYWSRDMAGAEARYKGLVNDFPDNADIKGELGNLYYAQRRNSEAAEMYHQAGLQLIKDGNPQQVMLLIGVLQAIAPAKATDLRQRLSQ
jgi:TolA-binding protein